MGKASLTTSGKVPCYFKVEPRGDHYVAVQYDLDGVRCGLVAGRGSRVYFPTEDAAKAAAEGQFLSPVPGDLELS